VVIVVLVNGKCRDAPPDSWPEENGGFSRWKIKKSRQPRRRRNGPGPGGQRTRGCKLRITCPAINPLSLGPFGGTSLPTSSPPDKAVVFQVVEQIKAEGFQQIKQSLSECPAIGIYLLSLQNIYYKCIIISFYNFGNSFRSHVEQNKKYYKYIINILP